MSVLDSPYANYLIRQFVLTSVTKISSRPTTSAAQQERISTLIATYTSNPELETQQRAVEFASLYAQRDEIRGGVLERMPPPELKATVMGIVVENKPVGSTSTAKDVSITFIVLLGALSNGILGLGGFARRRCLVQHRCGTC